MADFVNTSDVFVDAQAKTMNEALELLAQHAEDLGVTNDKEAVYQAFLARENMGSTGLVGGVAIPHAKCMTIAKPAVIIARYPEGLEWKSLDGTPIKLAISLLIPNCTEGSLHLKNLSKIAALLSDEQRVQELLNAQDAQTLVDLINTGIAAE